MAYNQTVQSIKTHLASAYAKLEEKGVTLPAKKNIQNLGETIDGVKNNSEKVRQIVDRTVTEITAEDLEGATIIGYYAFCGCQDLASVEIPETVTEIGADAFGSCISMQEINIPPSVTKIGRWAFDYCPKLKKAYIKDLSAYLDIEFGGGASMFTISYQVNSDDEVVTMGKAGDLYLNGQLLSVVNIPDGKTEIKRECFYGASITKAILPSTITDIGEDAFSLCQNLNNINLYDLTALTSIGARAFECCLSLEEAYIPDRVRSLGQTAFAYSGISKASIPVGTLSLNIFKGCKNLQSVEFRADNTGNFSARRVSIPDYTFASCSNLRVVLLNHTTYGIAKYAFENCANLQMIAFYGATSIPPLSSPNAFEGVPSTCEVIVPDELYGAWVNATNWANVNLTFKKVSELGQYFPTGLTWTFGTGITYRLSEDGESYEVVDVTAEKGYEESYKNITIPSTVGGKSVTAIADNAFDGNDEVVSITLPNTIISIGVRAFGGCKALTSINIPSSVTSIGAGAFSECESLTGLSVPATLTAVEDYTFYGCKSLTSLTLGSKVTRIGNSAFEGCKGLKKFAIPSTVTEIGSYAFYGCTGITSITIPYKVTAIGEKAFYTSGLAKATMKSSTPPTLGGSKVFPETCKFVVPEYSLSKYLSATNWSARAEYIEEEQELWTKFY